MRYPELLGAAPLSTYSAEGNLACTYTECDNINKNLDSDPKLGLLSCPIPLDYQSDVLKVNKRDVFDELKFSLWSSDSRPPLHLSYYIPAVSYRSLLSTLETFMDRYTPEVVVASMFIGTIFSIMLYGLLITQVYTFLCESKKRFACNLELMS